MDNILTLNDVLVNDSEQRQTLPSVFISHGAPTIAIEDTEFTQTLARLGNELPKPKLIIIMSAHWESDGLQVNSNPTPATWHDFGGFPNALYEINYPALGQQQAAKSLVNQLTQLGIAVTENTHQPFDHGVWTPLLHMYPKADVPIVQISLPYNIQAKALYQFGQLFAPLRKEQVLIIGSGSVTHNLRHVRFNSNEIEPQASNFKYWLIEQLKAKNDSLLDWQKHPLAKHNHPTPEHLLPLFFAYGAGETMGIEHESFAHFSLGMDIYRFD